MAQEIVESASGMTRRSLIGLGAAGGIGLAAAGTLGASAAAAQENSAAEGEPRSWRTPTDPITDYVETIEADIVIVGTGNAGSVALTTALDASASVIALQKAGVSVAHGLHCAGCDTLFQRAAGIEIDIPQWTTRWLQNTGGWASVPHFNLWVKYIGPIINKFFTLSLEEGCPVGPIVVYEEHENEDYWNTSPSTDHNMRLADDASGDVKLSSDYLTSFEYQELAEWLTQRAIAKGADVRYNTPAVQLLRDDVPNGTSGRVTGVIAQGENGYIKCVAKKAVILCAGGYSNDEEMKQEFLPHIAKLSSGYSTKGNVGDAHKMATWCGAQMRRAPHSSNPHYDPGVDVPEMPGSSGYPWLRVNLNGERFSNEDVPYEQIYAQDLSQPECTHFQVFDDKFEDEAFNKMPPAMMRLPFVFVPAVRRGVETGAVHVGNTIEELAESMGVPADALVKTVERYNELAYNGYDEDYGKQAKRLFPIDTPPFYAIKRRPHILDSMSGLMTNVDLQVLDENDVPIEGLYAAGNCQSPFFGGFVQPMNIGGMGSARAFTTGHVAALRAMGIEGQLWPTTDEIIAEHPDYWEAAKEMEALAMS